MSNLGGITDELRSFVTNVSIRSSVWKDIDISSPLVPGPASDPNSNTTGTPSGPDAKSRALAFLKPTIVLSTKKGSYTVAPWGVATKNYGSWLKGGSVALAFLAAYGVWTLAFGDPLRRRK